MSEKTVSALVRLPSNINQLNGLIDGIQAMLMKAEKLDQESVKWALPFVGLFWLYGSGIRDLLHSRRGDGALLWNAPALAALCRPLMEAYVNFYYFVGEQVSEQEKAFRNLLLERHRIFKHKEMLALTGMSNEAIATEYKAVSDQFERIKEELLKHPQFELLDDRIQRAIGQQMDRCVFESTQDVLVRSGVPIESYDVVFRYLSQWVHATPYALSSLQYHRADQENGAVNMTIPTGIAVACAVKLVEQFSEMSEQLKEEVPKAFWQFIGK